MNESRFGEAGPTDRTPALDGYGMARMSDDACWHFLEQHELGRVAIIVFGRPVVYPVNYAVDDRSVVFRTAPSAKLAAAATGQATAFEVDEAGPLFESGTSVMVHGHLRQIVAPDEHQRLERLPLRAWAPGHRDYFVRIDADRVTGRRIIPTTEADGLAADGG